MLKMKETILNEILFEGSTYVKKSEVWEWVWAFQGGLWHKKF